MSEPTNATADELLVALLPGLPEDFLMALRYFYYIKARSLVPDTRYDEAEKEFLARDTTDEFCTPLNTPGSDDKESYPHRIQALALYLAMCMEDQNQEHLKSAMPGKKKKK